MSIAAQWRGVLGARVLGRANGMSLRVAVLEGTSRQPAESKESTDMVGENHPDAWDQNMKECTNAVQAHIPPHCRSLMAPYCSHNFVL